MSEFNLILQSKYSKKSKTEIISIIAAHPAKMKELMECFFSENTRICQRAAWPVGEIGEKYPDLLCPFLPEMIRHLTNPKNDAIVRNTVRAWQFMKIPTELQGEIFEICFQYIINPQKAIAIRAFSMTVCANICEEIPELSEEVIMAINDAIEHGSSGIMNRGRKIILRLTNGKEG